MFRRLAAALARTAALLLAVGAAAAPGSPAPTLAARPGWVTPLEMAEPSGRDDKRGGVEYLLVDDQVLVGDGGAEHWSRRAVRITSLQGVDSESRIQIDWDPVYESLVLHAINVRREGLVVDRLDPAAIEVVRREAALEASLLDGTLSALVLIPDVRVGDVIEHEFTIRGRNPVFSDRWFGGFTTGWGVDVGRLGYRLLWPKARAMHWLGNGQTEGAEPVLSESGGLREARWDFEDVEPVEYDGDEPPWFDPAGGVTISEFASWSEVARWAVPLYQAPPAEGGVRDLLERVRSAGPGDEDRILAAIRFVQDDVRYLGLEIGTGSHAPSSPAVVLDRRFGDCKDKALLLVTLLRGLSVEADCALVSTTWLDELGVRLPSPGEFDHVIVRLVFGGKTFWIDPTMNAQRGPLQSRHVPRLGKALIIRAGTEGLVDIEPSPGDAPRTVVDARFVLPSIGGPASMTMRTSYHGRDADDVRAAVADESREQTEGSYRDYYARIYPGLQSARPLIIRDDESSNILVTEEAYRLPNPWSQEEDGTWVAAFRAPEIEALLQEPEKSERESPLALDHPRHVIHRLTIELPDDWNVETGDTEFESAGATFRRSVSLDGPRRIDIETEWTSQSDWIPASEAPRHVAMLREAADRTGFEVSAAAGGAPIPAGDARSSRGVNWSILALAFMTALWGVAGGLILVLRAPAAGADEPRLRLGGGLAVVAIVAALLPIVLGIALLRSLPPYELAQWIALTGPGSASYHPLAAPLLLVSLIGAVLLFVASVPLAPLLLMRRRSFRFAFLLVAVAWLAHLAFRFAASRILPESFPVAAPAGVLAAVAVAWLACAAYVIAGAHPKVALTR